MDQRVEEHKFKYQAPTQRSASMSSSNSKRHDSSSMLKLEAADYFKLNAAQVNMLCNPSAAAVAPTVILQKELLINSAAIAAGAASSVGVSERIAMIPISSVNVTEPAGRALQTGDKSVQKSRSRQRPKSKIGQADQSRIIIAGRSRDKADQSISLSPKARHHSNNFHLRAAKDLSSKANLDRCDPKQHERAQHEQKLSHAICSSTTSTNSLPSILSSPSISPSLVCPHLTLEDILGGRYVSRSPHTIGLCDRCKLDPPPNIHSPLSPVYRPSNYTPTQAMQLTNTTISNHQVPKVFSSNLDQKPPLTGNTSARRRENPNCLRRGCSDFAGRKLLNKDDSLDFYLDPCEIRRSQMSPIQRNSVEFIRRHSTEVGRVLKVYKNGQAFEKPLRICITRNEFANLNQLLDHINSRQLVPCGARYLFHLDGQLVYGVNELKHGSSYIVSGTRNFDTKASTVIKEHQKREQNLAHNLHERMLQRRFRDRRSSRSLGSLGQLARTDDGAEPMHYNIHPRSDPSEGTQITSKQAKPANQSRQAPSDLSGFQRSFTNRKTALAGRDQAGVQKPDKDYSTDGRVGFGEERMRSREVESKQPSQSSETLNLTSTRTMNKEFVKYDAETKQRGGNLSRAKSELSGSPVLKRRKNVTFMDTGQMSSPILRRSWDLIGDEVNYDTRNKSASERLAVRTDRQAENEAGGGVEKEANSVRRNEIGIQVSDSIDGYLIDLPLPLPKRGEEKREQQEVQRRLARNGTKAGRQKQQQQREPAGKAKKILTITERDLSLDEMDKLKDLDHGDHHNELHKIKHVNIELDSTSSAAPSAAATERTLSADGGELAVGRDDADQQLDDANSSSETKEKVASEGEQDNEVSSMAGEQSRHTEGEFGRGLDRLITRADSAGDELDEVKALPLEWKYPGGQMSSATPDERPVSQSEPNGVVRARVTTPTPSLSTTGGDNNSLSMSYEPGGASVSGGSLKERDGKLAGPRRGQPLPAKKQVPVRGQLCSGSDVPDRNFKLAWVNGFIINDLYPRNSTTAAGSISGPATLVTLEASSQKDGEQILLTPSKQAQTTTATTVSNIHHGASQHGVQFMPSERFSNWICHSRLHDELIYPAGCLVVLWCRWTHEQRYYSRHLTDVSAVALAPTQPDVVVSCELGNSDPMDRAGARASIHIWSSTSLETLMVVDEPMHLRGFRIFSLNLRKLPAEYEWSLLVGARDDRQTLQLLSLWISLHQELSAADGNAKKEEIKSSMTVAKASRMLQANQIPLLVTHLAWHGQIEGGRQPPADKARLAAAPNQDEARDWLLSFGRRHFQLWSPDLKRQKLQPMQANEKSQAFVEMMARANCIARLAPAEFLVGDSAGNVNLLIIGLEQRTPSKNSAKSSPTKSFGAKYNLEIVKLVNQRGKTDELAGPSNEFASSVTSLTRITGSIFASGDANCVVRFWKIDRKRSPSQGIISDNQVSCRQISCISLPIDLGFVCSIVSAGFDRKRSIVEFYLISTSNAILFGSIRLCSLESKTVGAATSILANSSLSVVYEGHETSVTNLVADSTQSLAVQMPRGFTMSMSKNCDDDYYFTCSLDYKICKWKGKSLVWKSMLPSACVSLAVHPIGRVLAIGSADGTVYVLDKLSGLLVSYFPLTPVCINCLAYSGDGSLLAAGCSNGSIFILPVEENGLKYKKVSIFQSPFPVVSLQFSLDNRYLLTSVTHSQYQDLILWDLPNFRYMRDNVRMVADKIRWFEPVCSGSEDVRAIWENVNLTSQTLRSSEPKQANKFARKRPSMTATDQHQQQQSDQQLVVNLSCHRLMLDEKEAPGRSLCIASDTRGYLRLFKYPCRDIEQAFYQARVTSSRLNCCRFLAPKTQSFVSSALDGSIFLWQLE